MERRGASILPPRLQRHCGAPGPEPGGGEQGLGVGTGFCPWRVAHEPQRIAPLL